MDITVDEIMVTCMARQIHNGEIVAQGLATPLVAAAYLLARHTHAPELYFASAIGQGVCKIPAPLSITNIESLWLDRALCNVGFVRAAADILPSLKPKEFFRPAQIDQNGNFNNVAFAKNYLAFNPPKPRMRLPGTGGIPDVTTFIDDIYLYVPRHSRVTFTRKLDVISGLGYHPNRKKGSGPKYLVSDFGQFNFRDGLMQLDTIHPGISFEEIITRTGFDLLISPDLEETPMPTKGELTLLREQIDPLNIRKLEMKSGINRRELLNQILMTESSEQ